MIEGKNIVESIKNDDVNENSNSNPKVQLKRSERLNFIEYGATMNYVRKKKKKGIDFYHEPKTLLDKKDANSPINFDKIS